jgi:hypothetical protein
MFQPFELFKPLYYERLKKLNKKYIVTQSYLRGFNHFAEAHKIDLLITDYDDLQYAQVHLNALKKDKLAAIIHLDNEKHKATFEQMMSGEKYCLYWSVVKSAEELQKRLDAKFSENIKRYIQKNTAWRINRETGIKPNFEVVFGELFLHMQYGSQKIRVKFEDIEKS